MVIGGFDTSFRYKIYINDAFLFIWNKIIKLNCMVDIETIKINAISLLKKKLTYLVFLNAFTFLCHLL